MPFKIVKAGIVVAGFLLAIPAFSQNTTHTKKTPAAGNSFSPEQSKMLCKAWKMDTITEFGTDEKANKKEATDGITFVTDGGFFFTEEGGAATGTWSYGGSRINTVMKDADRKVSFKIISLTDNRLVLEYQNPDLIRIKYTYSPKK